MYLKYPNFEFANRGFLAFRKRFLLGNLFLLTLKFILITEKSNKIK